MTLCSSDCGWRCACQFAPCSAFILSLLVKCCLWYIIKENDKIKTSVESYSLCYVVIASTVENILVLSQLCRKYQVCFFISLFVASLYSKRLICDKSRDWANSWVRVVKDFYQVALHSVEKSLCAKIPLQANFPSARYYQPTFIQKSNEKF